MDWTKVNAISALIGTILVAGLLALGFWTYLESRFERVEGRFRTIEDRLFTLARGIDSALESLGPIEMPPIVNIEPMPDEEIRELSGEVKALAKETQELSGEVKALAKETQELSGEVKALAKGPQEMLQQMGEQINELPDEMEEEPAE